MDFIPFDSNVIGVKASSNKQEIVLSFDSLLKLMRGAIETGSRKWEVSTEDSDYDYIVKEEDFIKVYPDYQKGTTYYCKHENRVFNFIVKDGLEHSIWAKATEILTEYKKALGKNNEFLRNKDSRVFIFTLIRTQLKQNSTVSVRDLMTEMGY
jgi:hypothetical protein